MPKSYVTGPNGATAVYYTSADLGSTSQGYRDPVTGALLVRGGIQERDDAWEDASGVWHLGNMPTNYQAPADTPPASPETPTAPTDTGGGGGGGGAVSTGDGGGFTIPPPTFSSGGGVPSYVPSTPVFTPPAYHQAPSFSYEDYRPTTADDLYADPSYKFRIGEGEQALTNSAAARGVANTGGTLKDFITYGQNAASQEFSAVDARRRADYTLNREGAVQRYNLNYGTQFVDPYKMAYQAAVDQFTPQMTGYQTQAQAGQHQADLDYQTWLQQYNIWRNNRNDTFDERYRITALQ